MFILSMNTKESNMETPVRWQPLVAKYQTPEIKRSLWQLATSVIPFVLMWYVMVRSLQVGYWLTLLLAIPTAGFMVRNFIIFHDCGHGSFFKSNRANEIVGYITGILAWTPYYYWRHEHAIHHATAGDLDRRGTGDVFTMTVAEYLAAPWWKKAGYRIMRNPLILFTIGSFLVFAVTHRFWIPGTGKRERNSVIITNLALAVIIAGLIWLFGWQAFLLVQIPVMFIACSAGVWLFYVQHNFDGTYWERHDKWEFVKAGINGSSFYRLPGILQWFTGNIGFHHIHHLSPKIPNYKLPVCYKENPVFQIRPITILTSMKSMGYRLWDEEQKMLVGFRELKKYRQMKTA
jgi:omega-6 fatty acid desaturase (delta-12 desaturase)